MIVSFFNGTVRTHAGESVHAVWANTQFGTMLSISGDEHAEMVEKIDILSEEPVTTCDLPGLDRAGIETLASSILVGGYLERAGVQGKDDAVLFLLVNEAIHRLEEIARKENL